MGKMKNFADLCRPRADMSIENTMVSPSDFLPYKQKVTRSNRVPPTKAPSKRKNIGAWIEWHSQRLKAKARENPARFAELLPTQIGDDTVIPIALNHGRHTLVSLQDYERVRTLRWFAQVDEDGRWYAYTHIRGGKHGTKLSMHRFIMEAKAGERIDHADGDGLHNWRKNLRRCTNAQNIRNSKVYSRKKTAKLKGVYFDRSRGMFRAQIMCAGKKINLGQYATEEEAGRVYDANARKLFGEFARLNFPQEAA